VALAYTTTFRRCAHNGESYLSQNTRGVYATCNVDVQWASEEVLNLPALTIVDVNGCFIGQTTSEQNQLFNNRNFVGPNEMVIYFVQATNRFCRKFSFTTP
jgi:hypothetical protein